MKSGKPAGASKILMEHSHLLKDNELVERVAQALINGEQQEKVFTFVEKKLFFKIEGG